jgi:hypothetical protein
LFSLDEGVVHDEEQENEDVDQLEDNESNADNLVIHPLFFMGNSYLVYKDIRARCTSIFEASSRPIPVQQLYGLLISGRKGPHKVQEDDAIRRLLCGYDPIRRSLLVGAISHISTNIFMGIFTGAYIL